MAKGMEFDTMNSFRPGAVHFLSCGQNEPGKLKNGPAAGFCS
jgi:hypothetical protein